MSGLHRDRESLEAGLEHVRGSPRARSVVALIVRRPSPGAREVVTEARLEPGSGLVGDDWATRGSRSTPDGRADPAAEVTIMNVRAVALVAGAAERWPLAGDQLYVDLDLGAENLPPGTRLAVGGAVVEVAAKPHTGCAKFRERFGAAALAFVNSVEGRRLNLRGINARVVQGGVVRAGDAVARLGPGSAP